MYVMEVLKSVKIVLVIKIKMYGVISWLEQEIKTTQDSQRFMTSANRCATCALYSTFFKICVRLKASGSWFLLHVNSQMELQTCVIKNQL